MQHDPLEKAYALIRENIQPIQSPTVFELGMCDGYHTGLLLQWFNKPRYFGFEPDHRNIAKIKASGIDARINFFAAAIGNTTGVVDFHLATPEPGGGIGCSSLSEFTPVLTQEWPWLKEQEVQKVNSWTLDDFCAVHQVPTIDFLWMDVQGAERLVFAGAQRMIPNIRLIWTEYDGGTLYRDSSTLTDLLKFFPGWQVIADCGGDALLKNPNFVL